MVCNYIFLHAAAGYGDPHLLTLDGYSYTFNGKGEFILLHSENFRIQGQMVQMRDDRGDEVGEATVFASIAVYSSASSVVELIATRLTKTMSNGEEGIVEEIHVKHRKALINFVNTPEIQISDVLIRQISLTRVELYYNSRAYVEVRQEYDYISTVLVALPESFQGKVEGLLGNYNGDLSDDLRPRDVNYSMPINSSIETIHKSFGMTCEFKFIIFIYMEKNTLFINRMSYESIYI